LACCRVRPFLYSPIYTFISKDGERAREPRGDPREPFLWHHRQLEESAAVFRWRVPLDRISKDQCHSKEFFAYKYPWKLLLFDRDVSGAGFLSFYLAVGDHEQQLRGGSSGFTPRFVQFWLIASHNVPARNVIYGYSLFRIPPLEAHYFVTLTFTIFRDSKFQLKAVHTDPNKEGEVKSMLCATCIFTPHLRFFRRT
jgi:hypothetical protein